MRTRAAELFSIEHPVVLGGMAAATGPELVAAVSNAGGLGLMGAARRTRAEIEAAAEAIRSRTAKPWGFNLLLFSADEEAVASVLAVRPPVFSTAWPWPEQDL